MTEEDRLKHRLRSLASAVPQQPRPELEQRLRAKFRAQTNQRTLPWKYTLAAAALLIVACGLYLRLSHRRVASQPTAAVYGADRATGFVALPYAQSGVPLEQAVIVRVNIPVSELGAMGMPLAAPVPGEKVAADLLIGQDGVARAVRLVE